MNPEPESQAWQLLRDRASAQIRPGFAERVLRAARQIAGPSPFSQLAFGAATVALCLMAIVWFQDRQSQSQRQQSLAAWQQVSMATDDLPAGQ